MVDFWAFKDFWIVVEHYWIWLVGALILGALVGWRNYPNSQDR